MVCCWLPPALHRTAVLVNVHTGFSPETRPILSLSWMRTRGGSSLQRGWWVELSTRDARNCCPASDPHSRFGDWLCWLRTWWAWILLHHHHHPEVFWTLHKAVMLWTASLWHMVYNKHLIKTHYNLNICLNIINNIIFVKKKQKKNMM